eukprot:NODE_237_length_2054_cov_75.294763_g203_i0.p1 GENE.NODE_237_length_2054_cov_75.294763_g203_i0~~NODE_237_length_2054_cov_75.294763_g203_i0.p1  ORF type:complete len:280 (+),score=62.20 NODE_237_length_2054_cov_75.294763_g203_i0:1132-1971(+)
MSCDSQHDFQVMKDAFELILDLIHGLKGTVGYVHGSLVVASWSSDRMHPDQVRVACKAALECVRHTKRYMPSINISGAIVSGRVCWGCVGNQHCMYTSVGPAMEWMLHIYNVSQRLPFRILMDEETTHYAMESHQCLLVDCLHLYGFSPLRVYQLSSDDKTSQNVFSQWNEMMVLLFGSQYDEAADKMNPFRDDESQIAAEVRRMIRKGQNNQHLSYRHNLSTYPQLVSTDTPSSNATSTSPSSYQSQSSRTTTISRTSTTGAFEMMGQLHPNHIPESE